MTKAAGLKLSDLKSRSVAIDVDVAGSKLHIEFESGFWTGESEEWYFSGGSFAEKNRELIARAVTSWDLLGDDGKPLELTPEALKPVPNWILDAVVGDMIRNSNPNATNSQG